MLQNLLKVFNGYWRMDFPDWGLIHVGDLSSRRIIQQLKFLPSSSYLFVSSSKNSTSFFQTKLASQHDGGDILAFLATLVALHSTPVSESLAGWAEFRIATF